MASIRVVVFRDGNLLVARGLDVDATAYAYEIDVLRDRFSYAVGRLQKAGRLVFGVDSVPSALHDMWKNRPYPENAYSFVLHTPETH